MWDSSPAGAAVEREVLVPAVCALPAPDLVSPVEDVSSDRSRPEGGQPGLQPPVTAPPPALEPARTPSALTDRGRLPSA